MAFGDNSVGGLFSTTNFALSEASWSGDPTQEAHAVYHQANFFLQYHFAANALTIVSGATHNAVPWPSALHRTQRRCRHTLSQVASPVALAWSHTCL